MRTQSPARPRKRAKLREPGWMDEVRHGLEDLINTNAGKNLPVVFDFDNTIVSGDIGEATLAWLVKTNALPRSNLSQALAPAFQHCQKGPVSVENSVDLTEYYEALLEPTAHGDADRTPLATGYAWAVEIMAGMSPWDVVQATKAAYLQSRPGQRRIIEVTPGKTSYPAPFFYPEMVELIGTLLAFKFDVWVISASNVWSVRWMLLKALNPLLKHRGYPARFRPDRIIGVSTLLQDAKNCLYKDPLLLSEHPTYAQLSPNSLKRYKLTGRLHFPVPTYSGKIAWIYDLIGQPPLLCAGDSPGDHPMLSMSLNRLWIARLDKPAYQQRLCDLPQPVLKSNWWIQPAIAGSGPRIVSDPAKLPSENPKFAESLQILRKFGLRPA